MVQHNSGKNWDKNLLQFGNLDHVIGITQIVFGTCVSKLLVFFSKDEDMKLRSIDLSSFFLSPLAMTM